MSDETDISCESESDIDDKHNENLVRHRMMCRMEIDPEIREKRHTESRDTNRERIWSEEPERRSNENRIEQKEELKSPLTHACFYFWSCLIEKIRIHQNMKNISMEKLIQKKLSNK